MYEDDHYVILALRRRLEQRQDELEQHPQMTNREMLDWCLRQLDEVAADDCQRELVEGNPSIMPGRSQM